MAASLATFRENLQKLIRKFEGDRAHYLSKDYPEAQVRMDFINPFFKALGWDVDNEQGLPHHQRECLVEKGAEEGRPDYSFRLGGQTKFFVEAKAPCHTLEDPRHILQAKGYAWNTKEVFFVILTDFEEFRFYDASILPDERKPDEGLLRKFKYTEYLDKIEELAAFSKERVAAGSLEALLPRDRRTQRLRIPVDKAFLEDGSLFPVRDHRASNTKSDPSLIRIGMLASQSGKSLLESRIIRAAYTPHMGYSLVSLLHIVIFLDFRRRLVYKLLWLHDCL